MSGCARPRVSILLSTYNGARWLAAQLDSLLAQSHEDWTLWARDDGSDDATVEILNAYARRDPRIRVVRGPAGNLGPRKSFFWLLEHADLASPYVMFCDQDDVWGPGKIAATLDAMLSAERQTPDLPLLVHSDMRFVDGDLNLLFSSAKKRLGFEALDGALFPRLLAQNVVTGCTAMINRRLAQACVPMPGEAMMHDWWIALVAAALGRVVYLNRADIDYRQHGGNASGNSVCRPPIVNGLVQVLTRPAHFDALMEGRFRQCLALDAHLSRFPATPASKLLSRFLQESRRGRVRTALSAWNSGVLMQGTLRNVLFYFLLLRRGYARSLARRSPAGLERRRAGFASREVRLPAG